MSDQKKYLYQVWEHPEGYTRFVITTEEQLEENDPDPLKPDLRDVEEEFPEFQACECDEVIWEPRGPYNYNSSVEEVEQWLEDMGMEPAGDKMRDYSQF